VYTKTTYFIRYSVSLLSFRFVFGFHLFYNIVLTAEMMQYETKYDRVKMNEESMRDVKEVFVISRY
jgi:hypothetical protein